MLQWGIISDKDSIYDSVIDKLERDTDYANHQIKLDIRTRDLKRSMKREFEDIDLFIVLSKETSTVIIKLLKYGVPFKNIVTSKAVDELSKYTDIIGKIYRNGVVHYALGEDAVPSDIRMCEVNYDYVRYRMLGLMIREIKSKKLPGMLAEVGVFQGDFSRWLNECFEDKELYLFDTFEGFDKNDIEEEKKHNVSGELQDVMENGFKDTSVEYVLKRMKNRDKCKVFKGYFPDTAKDVSGEFCFVSLDTDLYKPTKDGLEFFYPKLVRGGG